MASEYLNPQQQGGIRSLVEDLQKVKAAGNVGRSAGSNTVQNLASQNILSQITKGAGLPGLADNSIAQRLTAPVNTAYKLFGVPDQIKERLAQVMLDPHSAQSQAILSSIPNDLRPAIEAQLGPIFGVVGQASALGVNRMPDSNQSN